MDEMDLNGLRMRADGMEQINIVRITEGVQCGTQSSEGWMELFYVQYHDFANRGTGMA